MLKQETIIKRNKSKEENEAYKKGYNESEIMIRKRRLLSKKSKAENHFKTLLKSAGIRFNRENEIIRPHRYFFTDFYLPDLKVSVEIDGKEHLSKKKQDKYKEGEVYKDNKSLTVRFTNYEVLNMSSISKRKILHKLFKKQVVESNDSVEIDKHKKWYRESKVRKERFYQKQELDKVELVQSASDFDNSKIENELTVFIKGRSASNNNYSPYTIHFKVFEKDTLLEEVNETYTNEMFTSPNKSEVISAIKALEFIYNLGNTESSSIKIFTNSKFLEGKATGKFSKGDDNDYSIYTDSIKQFYEMRDLFTELKFQWIPKETNV